MDVPGFADSVCGVVPWSGRTPLRDDHEAMKHCLTAGAFLEEMVQGKILHANKVERKKKLYDLECTAANFEERGEPASR